MTAIARTIRSCFSIQFTMIPKPRLEPRYARLPQLEIVSLSVCSLGL